LFAYELSEDGLPEPDSFLVRTLHEIGHYEAIRRGLNVGCEFLAWAISAELLHGLGRQLPDWWTPLREKILTKRRLKWDEELVAGCLSQKCTHNSFFVNLPKQTDDPWDLARPLDSF
jgi:hypothetical protein